ncbi:hypothetical protein B296_00007815 [Ensete ventricosum]|uniref:Uncharacterized protein n=1 Tax=Ensete ventricosum TaxID=4639 RepID=A0A427AK75_ENSVE|nr:hypothetical protein B296_00007815 [Ensete ventricosum]
MPTRETLAHESQNTRRKPKTGEGRTVFYRDGRDVAQGQPYKLAEPDTGQPGLTPGSGRRFARGDLKVCCSLLDPVRLEGEGGLGGDGRDSQGFVRFGGRHGSRLGHPHACRTGPGPRSRAHQRR